MNRMKLRTIGQKGTVIILTFIIMTVLTAITVAFLSMIAIQTKSSGYDLTGAKALWLAEAGIQKAIWYLRTPVASGGQGEAWADISPVTLTESLSSGTYTMTVERWDFALAANGGAITTAESGYGGQTGYGMAIDGDDNTYWESGAAPSDANPQIIDIVFPYALTLNKARYLAYGTNYPVNYKWQLSKNGVSYYDVYSSTTGTSDSTAEFTAYASDNVSNRTNVLYIRLYVTSTSLDQPVRIATLEALGNKITSTGTVGIMSRKITQTVVVHDGVTLVNDGKKEAFAEKDWSEQYVSLY